MVGEPQVIIGAQIEDLALCHANLGPLWTEDLPFRFVEACRADFSKSVRNSFFE
jgi:hypothetical protein